MAAAASAAAPFWFVVRYSTFMLFGNRKRVCRHAAGSRLQLSDWSPTWLGLPPATPPQSWNSGRSPPPVLGVFPCGNSCCSCSSVWKRWGRGLAFIPWKGPPPPSIFPNAPFFYEARVPALACKRRPVLQAASTRFMASHN